MGRVLVLIAASLLIPGCGSGSTPVTPTPISSPASPIGVWVGSISDPLAGEGAARLSFAEQPVSTGLFPTPQGAVGGPWSVTFRNGDTAAGQASGVLVTGATYGFFLYPDVAPCLSSQGPATGLLQYTLTNAVVTSRTLTAVLVRSSCVDNRFGSISLTRQ
jgi:hypothetical protein